jgi:hypothetical protein
MENRYAGVMLVGCAAVAISISAAAAPADTPPKDLESAIIAGRLKLVVGKVTIRSSFSLRQGPQRTRDTTIWFDFSKRPQLRSDTVWGGADSRAAYGRQMVCKSPCLTGALATFTYDEKEPAPGAKPCVDVVDPENGQYPMYLVLDPRAIGLVPVDTLNLVYNKYGDVILATDRRDFKVEDAGIGREACYKVSFSRPSGASFVYLAEKAAPERVLHMEASTGALRDVVDSEYTYYESVRAWLPSRCSYSSTVGGKATATEVALMTYSDLGKSDPAAFCLAGMDIPAGVKIRGLPAGHGKLFVWDGAKVVATDPLHAALRTEGGHTVRLVVLIANLIVVAILVFLIARSRRATRA